MREVITLQLGELGNYIANHFWNAQESYFTYSKDDVSLVNHDVHWRQGLAPDGSETFLPRTVIYDFKQSLGSLRKISPLYDPDTDDAAATASALWPGAPHVHTAPPVTPSAFQTALDAGAPPTRPAPRDVRFWSDTTRVFYHPRSLVPLDDLELTTPKDAAAAGAAPWERGTQLFRALDTEADLLDRDLRPFAEEADCLQGVQVVAPLDDVWAPFAAGYVERLRDDYGKTSVVVWGAGTPETAATSAAARRSRLETRARALVDLWPQASLIVPLAPPVAGLPAGYTADWSSFWHTSALYATAMETAGLASRLARRYAGLDEMQAALNAHGRQTLVRLQMTARRAEAGRAEKKTAEKADERTERGEEEEEEMPDMDLDMFDLLGPVAGRMRGRKARSAVKTFSQMLTRRGLARADLRPASTSSASSGLRAPEYIGRTVTRRHDIALGFPLLDSFPEIYTGSDGSGDTVDVDVLVGADSSVSDEVEALKKASVFAVAASEREELGNGLAEIVDEYRDGWWSGSEEDD